MLYYTAFFCLFFLSVSSFIWPSCIFFLFRSFLPLNALGQSEAWYSPSPTSSPSREPLCSIFISLFPAFLNFPLIFLRHQTPMKIKPVFLKTTIGSWIKNKANYILKWENFPIIWFPILSFQLPKCFKSFHCRISIMVDLDNWKSLM